MDCGDKRVSRSDRLISNVFRAYTGRHVTGGFPWLLRFPRFLVGAASAPDARIGAEVPCLQATNPCQKPPRRDVERAGLASRTPPSASRPRSNCRPQPANWDTRQVDSGLPMQTIGGGLCRCDFNTTAGGPDPLVPMNCRNRGKR